MQGGARPGETGQPQPISETRIRLRGQPAAPAQAPLRQGLRIHPGALRDQGIDMDVENAGIGEEFERESALPTLPGYSRGGWMQPTAGYGASRADRAMPIAAENPATEPFTHRPPGD